MMEDTTVGLTKNGKRKWTVEQKLGIVNEFNSGVDAAELCRKYNIHTQMLYKWRKTLESNGKEGLRNNGEVIPKVRYVEALRKIEELEKALINADIIYIEGGNTFYLLKAIRETGFDKLIKEQNFVKYQKDINQLSSFKC